jgi:hypothetical protein
MSLQQIFYTTGGGVLLLLTLIQISPIKIDPWTAIFRAIGRAFNAELLKEVRDVRSTLDNHIKADDERNADEHRARILRFNNELIREIPHTKEEFIDVLADIDYYESYCRDHPDYKNNRAVFAIANIGKSYTERLEKHDFLT